jgi:AcrR family transcriptional regulator
MTNRSAARAPMLTVDAIREVSLDLFSTVGYEGASMRRIATAVGIQPASLYNHFNAKQDILRAICEKTMGELLSEQEAILGRQGEFPSDDHLSMLLAFVAMNTEYHIRERRSTRIINQQLTSLEEPYRSEMTSARSQYEERLRLLLENGNKAGTFSVPDVRLTTYAILAMGMHVSTWYHENGPFPPPKIIEEYQAIVRKMVSTTA